jgi:aspartyl-tRNA(Asn)/glutamyl-tRNA(Gln) amidotransferase subunit B
MADGHELEAVIGLEIHVQLATKTKMFCGCELSFGDEPNVHTCPVCLAHPGVLPVVNEQAIQYALQIGMALECEIALRSIFHRKNYFYPDSPKAYQISQYDIPICGPGRLGDVRIHRAHLEEDAAKMIHVGESGRIHGSGASLVDFNRGGTPLVEIVTEPCAAPPMRPSGRGCCARRCASSASPTSTWRRAACGSTPTSPCARPAARSSGPRPS